MEEFENFKEAIICFDSALSIDKYFPECQIHKIICNFKLG
jgi:hypothetical protein